MEDVAVVESEPTNGKVGRAKDGWVLDAPLRYGVPADRQIPAHQLKVVRDLVGGSPEVRSFATERANFMTALLEACKAKSAPKAVVLRFGHGITEAERGLLIELQGRLAEELKRRTELTTGQHYGVITVSRS